MIFLEGRDHFIVLRCPNMEFCYNFSMYGLFPVSFSALKQTWYRPTFASILEKRTESWALVGVGFLQIGLHLLCLPVWACPFKQLFGIPCPGCGLTSATGQFLHGQFSQSLHTHAFAPIFFGAFLLMGLVVLLPKNGYAAAVNRVARFESKTGLTAWLLVALMCYWCGRLLGFV
jgi:hypothetical protein